MGLAAATAAFLLIVNFVKFEYSYEDFHEKADDIYRVTLELYEGSKFVTTDCETYPPLGPLLKEDMPEVADYVRIQNIGEMAEMSYRNKVFRIGKAYAADPSVFSVFNYEFIEGDPSTALNEPMQTVVTETTAKRLFGTTHALGKTLKNGNWIYTVSGVIKDVPQNTHLKFDQLISLASLEKIGWDLNNWGGNNNYTYLLMLPNTNLSTFNEKLRKLSRERLKNELIVAEPVKDIHLYSHKEFEPEVNGDIKTVQFLFITAILILLVGSANYVNLTTARSAERAKEVGMRKVLGSTRGLLVKQFLTETLLINLIAMGLALLLIRLMLPFYFQLIGRPIEVDFFSTRVFWATCLGLFLLNGLLSGLYPALSLSGAKPAWVTSRMFTRSGRSNLFRKALVTGQFATALIILSASFIVFRQLSFMSNQDLGMNTSEILVARAPASGTDSLHRVQSQAFKNELLQLADVENVSVSGSLPGLSLHELSTNTGLTRYGSEQGRGYNYYLYGIDAHFIPTMEIKLAAGRNFRAGSMNKDEVIVSEEAARLLGFASPAEAVGRKISWGGSGYTPTIVGVVKNYHQQSLKEAILPMVHFYSNDEAFYSIKLHAENMRRAVAEVKNIWEAQFPGYPFEYRFFNEMFDQQYKADQRFGKIVGVFSGFTLLITCLGLLGLTAYSVSRRAKEIGIRKVLGASVASVVALLSKDFMKLVLVSILLATPLAWYAMNRWLEDFAYRIELSWWMFALAGLLVIAIALLTVSFQSVKAALMNPVKSLRSE